MSVEERDVVLKQIARLQDALSALRADVSERNFEVLAVGYREEIDKLRAEITPPTVEEVQAGLMQLMRDVGDLITKLRSNKDLLFDVDFPWDMVSKVCEQGRKCRGLLGPHELADLTNDQEHADAIRRALAIGKEKCHDDET